MCGVLPTGDLRSKRQGRGTASGFIFWTEAILQFRLRITQQFCSTLWIDLIYHGQQEEGVLGDSAGGATDRGI